MALGLELHLVRSPGFSRNLLSIAAAIPPKGGTTNLNQVPFGASHRNTAIQARRADTLVIVSAFQAFGNYTSAILSLAAPALDVPGLYQAIPT